MSEKFKVLQEVWKIVTLAPILLCLNNKFQLWLKEKVMFIQKGYMYLIQMKRHHYKLAFSFLFQNSQDIPTPMCSREK